MLETDGEGKGTLLYLYITNICFAATLIFKISYISPEVFHILESLT